ncbi:MAG: hypothetical protein ACYTBV_16190, partial [Planctomycetota bacterium]
MNSANKEKVISGSRKTGMISIGGLLFFLPFNDISIMRDVLFAAALLAFVVLKIVDRQSNPKGFYAPIKPLAILIVASILWGFVSLANAVDPEYSLRAVIHKMGKPYILYFLTFFFVAEISSDNDKLKRLLFPLALGAIIMGLYACYQFYQAPAIYTTRVKAFTGEIFRFSVFLVLSIPIVVSLALTMKSWLRSILI